MVNTHMRTEDKQDLVKEAGVYGERSVICHKETHHDSMWWFLLVVHFPLTSQKQNGRLIGYSNLP